MNKFLLGLLLSLTVACHQSNLIVDPAIDNPEEVLADLLGQGKLTETELLDYYDAVDKSTPFQSFFPSQWKPVVENKLPLTVFVMAGPENLRGTWIFNGGTCRFIDEGLVINYSEPPWYVLGSNRAK
jgi:hypothetical protein